MMGLESIGMALIVSVTASIGADPDLYQAQSWEAPTAEEIQICASMAQGLNDGSDYLIAKGLNRDWQSKSATCEVFLLDDPVADEPEISRVNFKF